jgi:hypothetical protein
MQLALRTEALTNTVGEYEIIDLIAIKKKEQLVIIEPTLVEPTPIRQSTDQEDQEKQEALAAWAQSLRRKTAA